MHQFSNVYSELIICAIVGAISGYARLRYEKVPASSYNVTGYMLVGALASVMGIGFATHFTTCCEFLIAVAVFCGQFGERSFELVAQWLKNKANTTKE